MLPQAHSGERHEQVIKQRAVKMSIEQDVVAIADTAGQFRLPIVPGSREVGKCYRRRVAPVGRKTQRRGVHVIGLVVDIRLRRDVAGDQQQEQRQQQSENRRLTRTAP